MVKILPLELKYREESHLTISLDEPILLGDYDIMKGKLVKLYLRNPNKDLVCNVSDIHSVDDDFTFVGPESGFIGPDETIQVLIKIHGEGNLEKIGVEPLGSVSSWPSGNGRLDGKIIWEKAMPR